MNTTPERMLQDAMATVFPVLIPGLCLGYLVGLRGMPGDDGLTRPDIARAVRAVALMPGSGEYALATSPVTQEAASEILLVARWFRLREREITRVLKPEDWLERYAPGS